MPRSFQKRYWETQLSLSDPDTPNKYQKFPTTIVLVSPPARICLTPCGFMSVLSSSYLENTFDSFIFLKMYSSIRISLCIRMICMIMNYERDHIMNLKFPGVPAEGV